MERHEGKTKGAHLLLGTRMGNSALRPAILRRVDSKGRDYTVLVPYDSPVEVVASSGFYELADDNGKAFGKGGKRYALFVRRTEKDKKVTLRVINGSGN